MAESPSGVFPDYRLAFDVSGFDDYRTELLTARSGREQRRAFGSRRRRWTASSHVLTVAQRKVLLDFFVSKQGRYGAFYFWNPIPENLSGYACGTVSGSATFDIPVKGLWWKDETAVAASVSAVYVGGVSKAFTIAPNMGSNGEDRVTFNAGAQTGAVTVDASNARVRVTARFLEDTLREAFRAGSFQHAIFPIGIQELI